MPCHLHQLLAREEVAVPAFGQDPHDVVADVVAAAVDGVDGGARELELAALLSHRALHEREVGLQALVVEDLELGHHNEEADHHVDGREDDHVPEGHVVGYDVLDGEVEDDAIIEIGSPGAAVEAAQGNYDGFDYDSAVVFPFGYGLSHTTFEQKLDSVEVEGDQVVATVSVTNTGSVAGKTAVQIYYSAPHTKGGIEKSAVVLGNFGRTQLLDPSASETLTTYEMSHLSNDGTTATKTMPATTVAMSSFNYVGTEWSGGRRSLQTGALRDEWGFKGFALTDFNLYSYMQKQQALFGRTDAQQTYAAMTGGFQDTKSATAVSALREASHRLLFAVVNSNAMNGMVPGSSITYGIALWQYMVWGASAVLVGVGTLCGWLALRKIKAAEAA